MTPLERDYGYTIPPTGYRLPEDIRLGEVRLQVADLARSIAYYERVIGLRVIENAGSRARLGAADSDTTIVELNEKHDVNPVPRRGRLGLYHFAILLPDRASLARFLQHLSDIGEYAGMSDHLVSEAIYLTDPDGLGIEVYADRARSTWKQSGKILNIGSIHLDTADLLKAGAGGSWTGAPSGTTIGHVHLYVNDLSLAEKFYHDATGFDKVSLQFPGALFMSAGGYHHHLGTNTWAAQAPQATDADARLLEWTIDLPTPGDVEALGTSLTRSGYSVTNEAGELVTSDPWTTRVRFRARK